MGVDPKSVVENLEALRERMAAVGRADIEIVAVTKTFGIDAVDAAMAAGLASVGENYSQECVAKLSGHQRPPIVHFIGHLQRNKIRKLAPIVDIWQTIDRVEIGAEIAKRAPGAKVMAQVNISGEATKSGCEPSDTASLVGALANLDLDVIGLMGIGPLAHPELSRPGFKLLRSMVDRLGLAECSMGMSGDLEVAIAEGSTMVRVGRGLFGERPPMRH